MRKFPFSCFLVVMLLGLMVPLFATPGVAQTSASSSILRNGDFSNGLTGWTAGPLRPSSFPGYPKWGIFNSTPWRSGVNPFAFLDVPGGSAAYLESDPFLLPVRQGGWTLDFTLWGMLAPVILQVQLRSQAGLYTLDSFEPPKVELGQQSALRHYLIPSNFTGQNVAVRFTCADTPPNHVQGVYCGFDDMTVTPAQPVPIVTTTMVQTTQIPPPSSGFGGRSRYFSSVLVWLLEQQAPVCRSLFVDQDRWVTLIPVRFVENSHNQDGSIVGDVELRCGVVGAVVHGVVTTSRTRLGSAPDAD